MYPFAYIGIEHRPRSWEVITINYSQILSAIYYTVQLYCLRAWISKKKKKHYLQKIPFRGNISKYVLWR